MARHTCMVCLESFQSRNGLFCHLEKENHAVDPHTSRIGDYTRPKECLPEVKKQKRKHRSPEQPEEKKRQIEEMMRRSEETRQRLLVNIQNCPNPSQRHEWEAGLKRVELLMERTYSRYVAKEIVRVLKIRSPCKCEVCGRVCRSRCKLMRHRGLNTA